MVSETLEQKNNSSLMLPGQHAKWLYYGKQPIIVLDKNLSDVINNSIFLCDNEMCYGNIRLLEPNKITKTEFDDRLTQHLCTADEIKDMDMDSLYEYPFQWLGKMDTPKMWSFSGEKSLLNENIEFLNNETPTIFHRIEQESKSSIKDKLPERLIFNMKRLVQNKQWMPFAMHIHMEDNEVHRDIRLFIPKPIKSGVLTYDNAHKLHEKNELYGIVEVLKLSENTIEIKNTQNNDWLFFEGYNDENNIFIPLSKGIYTSTFSSNNKICITLKTDKLEINKQLLSDNKINADKFLEDEVDGYYIINSDGTNVSLKKIYRPGALPKLSSEEMSKICELREKHSIREICDKMNLSNATVYRYLNRTGSIYPK